MGGKNVYVGAVLLIGLLAALPVEAGGGQASQRACPPLTSCVFRNLTATGTLTSAGATSLNGGCFVSSGSGNTLQCSTSMSTNQNFGSGTNSQLNWGTGFISIGDGSAASPQFRVQSDTNTGLYSVGADQLGVATNGARSFNFNAIAGRLEGTTSTQRLALNAADGSSLVNGLSDMTATNTRIYLRAGGNGIELSGGNFTTGFVATALSLQTDANSGRLYWTPSATVATAPPVDLGGAPHWALQQRSYGVDMGTEGGGSAPTWSNTPKLAGAAVTFTITDAAVATSTVVATGGWGTWDSRDSNTAAAAASKSDFLTTPFLTLARRPRWCQRVLVPNTSSIRVWAGLATAVAGSSDTPATSSVAFRFSTAAGDTNWAWCTGAGTVACTATTAVPTAAGDLLCIDCREGSACTWWINGVAVTRQTASLPVSTTKVGALYSVEALAASSRSLRAGHISIETN